MPEGGTDTARRRPKLPPPPSTRLGDAVRTILEERGLSLQQAARECNGEVSYGTIRSMCQGIVPNDVELLIQFAEAMTVDPNALLDAAGKEHVRYVKERRSTARFRLSLSMAA